MNYRTEPIYLCHVHGLAIIISIFSITNTFRNVPYYWCSRYSRNLPSLLGSATILWQFWKMKYWSEPLYDILYSQSSTHSGSSTSFSFRNVTPDDTKPYIMRVVVKPSTAESMRSTIKRQIWIPGMELRIVQALCACMHIMWNVDINEVAINLATLACSHTGMQNRWYSFYLGNCCQE